MRFEKTPPRVQDLDQLIKWQMRKAAPFRIEDAQVAWTESGPAAGGGHEYLVVLARRDIIESYERACDAAGLYAGLVDIASLNMVNAVLATQPATAPGDWLLIHVAPGYATIAIVRAGRIIFFRNRQAEGSGPADLERPRASDRDVPRGPPGGGAFTRAVVSGASAYGPEAVERTRRQIEEWLGIRAELLDVRAGVTLRDRIVASPELIDSLAPASGILLRDRPASARNRTERVA